MSKLIKTFLVSVMLTGCFAMREKSGLPTSQPMGDKEKQRNSYIHADEFPKSQKDFVGVFGKIKKQVKKEVPNPHTGAKDYVEALDFDGAYVEIYHATAPPPKEVIVKLKIFKNWPRVTGPVKVGTTRKEFESTFNVDTEGEKLFKLCEIQDVLEGGYSYGPACTLFEFKNNKVFSIEWNLPLD